MQAIALAICAACFSARVGFAQASDVTHPFYAQALVGASSARFNGSDFRSDVSDVERSSDFRAQAIGLIVGYPLTPRWAIEGGVVDLGTFSDQWTAHGSPLFNDIDHRFRYQARSSFLNARMALSDQGALDVGLRLGLAFNAATNEYRVDSSRHIEPPLAPCLPAGTACHPAFSSSAVFATEGRHSTTRISPLVGLSMGYRITEGLSTHVRYDRFGLFGRRGSVGRVEVDALSVVFQGNF